VHVSATRACVAAAVSFGLAVSPASAAAPRKKADAPTEKADAPVRVGVLPLVIAGEVAPEVGDARDRLSQEVLSALADPRLEAVSLHSAETGDAATPYCSDAVCWQALANEHGVSHFAVVVVRHSDPDYDVQARLVDGRTGAEVGSVSDTCDLCGITELGEHVGDVSAKLRRELESTLVPAPVLVVSSTPPGATVHLDGEVVGSTPLELASIAGTHELEIRRAGHVTERMRLDLVDGTRREIDARLRPLPTAPAPADAPGDRAARIYLGSGIAAMLAGAGAIGGGAAMLLMHDEPIEADCDGTNVDELGRCRYLHDTRGGGIALTVVGASLLVAGVALTVLGARRRAQPRTASASLHGLGIAGRF
jgi:TolB-like protein